MIDWQINDWADLSEVPEAEIPCKIVELRCDELLEIQPGDTACDVVGYDMIRPIHLRGEILEKNSWEWKYPLWVLKKNTLIRLGWEPGTGRFIFGWSELPNPVRFVHQVQHILRVCGMNDFATNFQI